MPERINPLPASFFETIDQLSFQEIAFEVAKAFFGEDIPEADLKELVSTRCNLIARFVPVQDNIYSLELFHGQHWHLKMSVAVSWRVC